MKTCTDANGDTWTIYYSGGYRWQRKARNGNIVGASTEAYTHESDCIQNARRNGMGCNPQ